MSTRNEREKHRIGLEAIGLQPYGVVPEPERR